MIPKIACLAQSQAKILKGTAPKGTALVPKVEPRFLKPSHEQTEGIQKREMGRHQDLTPLKGLSQGEVGEKVLQLAHAVPLWPGTP
jgi:hypothetical protein